MNAKQYFFEFIHYFCIISVACIIFDIITHGFGSINWQNSIIMGFLFALVYPPFKVVIRNKIKK